MFIQWNYPISSLDDPPRSQVYYGIWHPRARSKFPPSKSMKSQDSPSRRLWSTAFIWEVSNLGTSTPHSFHPPVVNQSQRPRDPQDQTAVPQRRLLQPVAWGLGAVQPLAPWHLRATCHGRPAAAQKHPGVQRRWGAGGALSQGEALGGQGIAKRNVLKWPIPLWSSSLAMDYINYTHTHTHIYIYIHRYRYMIYRFRWSSLIPRPIHSNFFKANRSWPGGISSCNWRCSEGLLRALVDEQLESSTVTSNSAIALHMRTSSARWACLGNRDGRGCGFANQLLAWAPGFIWIQISAKVPRVVLSHISCPYPTALEAAIVPVARASQDQPLASGTVPRPHCPSSARCLWTQFADFCRGRRGQRSATTASRREAFLGRPFGGLMITESRHCPSFHDCNDCRMRCFKLTKNYCD